MTDHRVPPRQIPSRRTDDDPPPPPPPDRERRDGGPRDPHAGLYFFITMAMVLILIAVFIYTRHSDAVCLKAQAVERMAA